MKVRADGEQEQTVWTRTVDPLAREGDARWVPGEVDLSPWARKDVELTLETRAGDDGSDPARAFWGAPAVVGGEDEAPLIVLYVVDTLRADHTGPYGHTRDTTPALNELARDAVVFEQAVAQSSWTKPSMASMMTSLLPAEHGASRRLDRLSPDRETVAELLQDERLGHRGGGGERPPLHAAGGLRPGLRLLRRSSWPQAATRTPGPGQRCRRRGLVVDRQAAGAAHVRLDPHHGSARAVQAAGPVRPDVSAPMRSPTCRSRRTRPGRTRRTGAGGVTRSASTMARSPSATGSSGGS